MNSEKIPSNIYKLEKIIGYEFKDKSLLIQALTHSSYSNQKKPLFKVNNERLEFLGDSVLSMVVSEFLFTNFEELPEGELTKIRSNIVCAITLSICARDIGLGQYLFLGKGEIKTGGMDRDSLLADAYEAIIGAIFIDTGIDNAKKYILDRMKDIIIKYATTDKILDYKTQLQELVQGMDNTCDSKIEYNIVDEKGPDHNKIFIAQVIIGNKIMGEGMGRNKKEAEQKAAEYALGSIND